MRKISKVLVLVLSAIMVLAMSVSVFAAGGTPSITINSSSTSGTGTQTESTVYTYWKILSADIDSDPTVGPDGTTTQNGQVAYYVTTEAAKNAIEATNLFNVTQVGSTNKWYVELKQSSTTAQDIIDALSTMTDTQLTAAFGNPGTMTMSNGKASSGTVEAGYYLIKSSLGSQNAIQTLSPVTINEKNDYVTDNKAIPSADEHSQIGQEITYTLTVNVPATANDQIVLTDTLSKGLTFKEVKSQSPITGTVSPIADAGSGAKKFTITYTADQIKTLVADKQAQVITVEVTAIVNEEAAIDTNISNTLDLKYGSNYESVPVTVNTKTTKFDFDKVDKTNTSTKLPGANFQLTTADGTLIKLIKITEGQTYRIATAAEIAAGGASLVDTIITNGNTITVNGLDGDLSYKLVETKAPTGYNKLNDPISVNPTDEKVFEHLDVENNKGVQLPSTGGIGTTIFYIVGSLLVIGCGIVLVSRRRMRDK